jgi:hypothetical protein
MMIAKGDKCESTFPFFIFPHFADFVQNIKQNPSFAITDLLYPTFLVELTICLKLQWWMIGKK